MILKDFSKPNYSMMLSPLGEKQGGGGVGNEGVKLCVGRQGSIGRRWFSSCLSHFFFFKLAINLISPAQVCFTCNGNW